MAQLPPHLQRAARDSYAIALRAVFILAACSTLLAYIARLPVRRNLSFASRPLTKRPISQIPDKSLDGGRPRGGSTGDEPRSVAAPPENPLEVTGDPDDTDDTDVEAISDHDDDEDNLPPIRPMQKRRRLSTYESSDGGMDLEGEEYGGSARPRSVPNTL